MEVDRAGENRNIFCAVCLSIGYVTVIPCDLTTRELIKVNESVNQTKKMCRHGMQLLRLASMYEPV